MSRRLGLALAVLALLGAACTQQKVNEAEVGIRYTDGPIDGKHFDKVVPPGGSEWVWNDHVYRLPARQITWISSGGGEADAEPLSFRAKDGEGLQIELATRFFLNTNEEAIKPFFLEICQKFDCWDGATQGGKVKTDDGWGRMLRETIGNPQQAVARDVGLEFEAEALRYDNRTRDAFATRFAEEFAAAQRRLIGGADYFCGPGFKRGEDTCPDISVEITAIRYINDDLETIRERQQLALKQQELAVQEEAAARAQQRVTAAKATPEFERLRQAEAMLECAKNPECQLTVIVGSDEVGVSVPAG